MTLKVHCSYRFLGTQSGESQEQRQAEIDVMVIRAKAPQLVNGDH